MQMVFGHRGASGYAPENTLEAFELAAKLGADGVELDVHIAKDGELVVAHDERIDRVANGTGLIAEMTTAELKKLKFNRTHPEYENATLPTLREDLAALADVADTYDDAARFGQLVDRSSGPRPRAGRGRRTFTRGPSRFAWASTFSTPPLPTGRSAAPRTRRRRRRLGRPVSPHALRHARLPRRT